MLLSGIWQTNLHLHFVQALLQQKSGSLNLDRLQITGEIRRERFQFFVHESRLDRLGIKLYLFS